MVSGSTRAEFYGLDEDDHGRNGVSTIDDLLRVSEKCRMACVWKTMTDRTPDDIPLKVLCRTLRSSLLTFITQNRLGTEDVGTLLFRAEPEDIHPAVCAGLHEHPHFSSIISPGTSAG